MFAPVTRVELDAALAAALEPIRSELAAVRGDIEKLFGVVGGLRDRSATKAEFHMLRADIASLREHGATKADVEAMGRRIVMWVGGLLAVFVAVMGWLVGSA